MKINEKFYRKIKLIGLNELKNNNKTLNKFNNFLKKIQISINFFLIILN